jgi:hypothetical protein
MHGAPTIIMDTLMHTNKIRIPLDRIQGYWCMSALYPTAPDTSISQKMCRLSTEKKDDRAAPALGHPCPGTRGRRTIWISSLRGSLHCLALLSIPTIIFY